MDSSSDKSTTDKTLWAEPVPYDPSCMDSWSEQTLQLTESPPPQQQTPAHQHILGFHNHPNSPHTNITPTTLFPAITLSPITHNKDTHPEHMNVQKRPPTQHMNEPHDIIHKWIKRHTEQLISNTTHSISSHLYMNDSQSQHTSYNQNSSHSFTYMNDTYLVVHNHSHNNSFD